MLKQELGVIWQGGILADDIGLGKTTTSIALMVIGNWIRSLQFDRHDRRAWALPDRHLETLERDAVADQDTIDVEEYAKQFSDDDPNQDDRKVFYNEMQAKSDRCSKLHYPVEDLQKKGEI